MTVSDDLTVRLGTRLDRDHRDALREEHAGWIGDQASTVTLAVTGVIVGVVIVASVAAPVVAATIGSG
ncbi:hypothetical protein AAH978_19870 [Streptomyces sp. ZYX-F-203]